VSLGFTGQYMNVTTEPIPEVIERSIANREFAVAEGASSDQPAIIGRVLKTGENTFSVLAIVTRGRDEKGRSASMYRYFFTQGKEKDAFLNLRYILAWWESQETPPRFNPFDIQEVGNPHICDINTLSFPQVTPREIDRNDYKPILLSPTEQLNLLSINILALKKYNTNPNGQLTSWAFNVEALEKPERFLVIQAASDKAYQILQKAITNTPKALLPAVVTDEEAIKSAIRGLMNSSQVKPENVKVMADALANDKIISAYWHTLFDGQGAKTAIGQKIYSPQMVRLITLRAVVIPETMLEFLSWLNIKPGQKTDDNQTVSLEFQKAIRPALPKDKLANSIKCILPELLNESSKITPEAIAWLLKSNDSVWASGCKDFINDVLYDLQLIFESLKGKNPNLSSLYKCDPQTWARLDSYKRLIYSSHAPHKLEEYTGFAKLFENLEDYPLSAYFYQVSQCIVPKRVFEKLPNSHNDYSFELIGLRLNREVTLSEQIIYYLFYWRYIVPIQAVIILLILSFTSGVLLERGFLSTNQVTTSPAGNINWKITASQQFDITRNAIDQIIKNINNEENKQRSQPTNGKEIIIKIKSVLKADNVNYADAKASDGKDKNTNDFVEAIYQYQKKYLPEKNENGQNNWDGIGIITPNGQTAERLEKEVKYQLGIFTNPPPGQ
ncbi:MAG: hypothetical protein ACKPIB_17345, partial [Dolichospermum sp.]